MTDKRTALVTGAGSGIGKAVATELAQRNYHVLVTDVNPETSESVASGLREQGLFATGYKLDVSRQEDIDALVSEVHADILINNAGLQYVAKLESFPADKWRLLTDVLLVGPAMLTRAFLPQMKARGFGRIVNIGSIHALVASPYKSAYVAAKHGLLGFSKVIALETAEFDITINTICPSYVKTPLVEKQISQQAVEHGISEEEVIRNIMLEPMPKKAFIEMSELCASLVFLLSDAARNMTGQTLVLDGGWTAR